MLVARLTLKTKISHILNLKRAIVAVALLAGIATSLLLVDNRQQQPDSDTVHGHSEFITVAQLPLEGQRVYALILQGGPLSSTKRALFLATVNGYCQPTREVFIKDTPLQHRV